MQISIDNQQNRELQDMILSLLQVIFVKVGDQIQTEVGEKIVQLIIQ